MHRSIVEVSFPERGQGWSGPVPVRSAGPERGVLLSACNAANGEGGWAAPGQLVVLRGENLVPHSAALGSVKVLFDGLPATVLSQSPAEILAVVPYALHGRDWVSVVVESLGQRSSAISLMMVDANPALFTVNGQGCGQAAADNGDGTPNSAANPVTPGAFITLFGTGEGRLERGPDSQGQPVPYEPWLLPTPVLPVRLIIGSEEAGVLYAGPMPGSAFGKLQLIAQVPRTLPAGPHEVCLQVGSFMSRSGVTICVG